MVNIGSGHSHRADLTCNHELYGLSCGDYDAMRARAREACEICETAERDTTRGQLVIDHFQGEGLFIVRGLLCDRCNSVMSRHDRTAEWGPSSLPWKEKARAYHLNAFSQPTADELRRADEVIAARTPYSVRNRPPLPRTPRRKHSPRVHLNHGPKQIARAIRKHLTPEQIGRLVQLLTEAEAGEPHSHSAATR
ncbi:hypothetical protein F8R89_30825 [Streptomyces sp. SS1-1]|uniref:endonuclease domain-containing protein n=1 Tax=Streptomyces sp. SS1-1 TaxID=2651869 RepID=UPI0012505742|nr:endonuclease domain-containing protein [Streptomyces sp. SS1-1]KAB2976003.1 hypothetical protein F8R89_30825 [Streptomyces sp. SS1-1]